MILVMPWQVLPAGPLLAIPLNCGFCMLGIELVLLSFEHIPFTYRVQMDSRKMVIRFILALIGIVVIVPFLARLEEWAVVQLWRYAIVAAAIALAWLDLRRRRRANEGEARELSFEERAPSEFELLKLA